MPLLKYCYVLFACLLLSACFSAGEQTEADKLITTFRSRVAARKQQVEFAPTTFVSQVVLAARKDTKADVNDLSTFAGKTVSATAGGQTFKVAASISAG